MRRGFDRVNLGRLRQGLADGRRRRPDRGAGPPLARHGRARQGRGGDVAIQRRGRCRGRTGACPDHPSARRPLCPGRHAHPPRDEDQPRRALDRVLLEDGDLIQIGGHSIRFDDRKRRATAGEKPGRPLAPRESIAETKPHPSPRRSPGPSPQGPRRGRRRRCRPAPSATGRYRARGPIACSARSPSDQETMLLGPSECQAATRDSGRAPRRRWPHITRVGGRDQPDAPARVPGDSPRWRAGLVAGMHPSDRSPLARWPIPGDPEAELLLAGILEAMIRAEDLSFNGPSLKLPPRDLRERRGRLDLGGPFGSINGEAACSYSPKDSRSQHHSATLPCISNRPKGLSCPGACRMRLVPGVAARRPIVSTATHPGVIL